MKKRPTSVSVIGWFWRVGGILGMAFALPLSLWGQDLFARYWANALLRLSPTVLFLWMFLSSVLCLLAGNGILKGRSWARTLALAYCVFATLTAALLYQGNPFFWSNLIGDLVFAVVMWYFLFRTDATAFFERQEAKKNPCPGG